MRALAVGLLPSNPPGGVWGLSHFWAIWGEKSPEKKVSKCVWGVFMIFPDGFDAFWALQTPIWVLDHVREASRCLVACKEGFGDLAVFGRSGVKKQNQKNFQIRLGIPWGGIYDVSRWF